MSHAQEELESFMYEIGLDNGQKDDLRVFIRTKFLSKSSLLEALGEEPENRVNDVVNIHKSGTQVRNEFRSHLKKVLKLEEKV